MPAQAGIQFFYTHSLEATSWRAVHALAGMTTKEWLAHKAGYFFKIFIYPSELLQLRSSISLGYFHCNNHLLKLNHGIL